ncbi:MAG TPA: MFS transporter [Vicinamibacterales bacterium]|nr:MFS transporter [Vicinamibacterales bacterium]
MTRPSLPGGVWRLGWISFFTDLASEMIYPLLPGFILKLRGGTPFIVGLIEGVAEAVNSVFKVLSGRRSDRTGARKPLMAFGYTVSSLTRPVIAVTTAWWQVLGLRFIDRFGKGVRGAPRDAMLATLAPVGRKGAVFGFHRAMDHAGAIAGPLIATAYLALRPEDYRGLFALTAIPGLVVIALVWTTKEPVQPAPPATEAAPSLSWSALPTPTRRLLLILLFFSLGNSTDAFLLIKLEASGVPVVWLPMAWAALHVVKSASSAAGGLLADRIGYRAPIIAGWLLYAGVYAGFAFADTAPVVVALFLTYGFFFGLTEGPEKALIAELSPAQLRGTAFGFYNAALGLGLLAASLLFGAIWVSISPAAAFLTGAGIALVAAALLAAGIIESE